MTLKIKNGWVVGVRRVATNKMGGSMVPKGIVMHYTAGWTTNGDVATLSTSDRKASVQFVLGRDGELVQIVPCDRVAWHAGPSRYKNFTGLNNDFIGIEICNAGWIRQLSNGNFIDQYSQQITPDGQFVGQHRKTWSPPREWHEEFHPRLAKGTYRWEPFYPQQLDALDDLVDALLKTYPTIKHIVTHEQIDTRGWKTDTGPMFDMRRYTKLLEDRSSTTPPAPVPVLTPMPTPAIVIGPRPTDTTAFAPVAPPVVPAPAPPVVPAPTPKRDVFAARSTMYLRATPAGYLSHTIAMAGARVYVNKIDGEWAEVYGVDELAGIRGWMPTDNLVKEE